MLKRRDITGAAGRRGAPRKAVKACAAVALAVMLSSCATSGGPGASVAPRSSVALAQEQANARKFDAQILSQKPIFRDRTLNGYVTEIAMKLHRVRPAGSPQPIVRVIDDKTPNAFTTGGGYVYVHTGLIRIMQNEAELAMVLGHEMAHGDLNHIRERGRAAATTSVLGQLAGVVIGQTIGGGLGGAAANTAAGLALQAGFTSFSRDQERGADEIGLRYIARSGYDDRAGAQAFGSLQRASGGRRGGPSWLSTHPLSGERLATLSAMSERTQGGNFVGRDVYQRRALSRLR